MPTPFEPRKTIKELGVDTTKKFVVVDDTDYYGLNKGDILTLDKDDETYAPYFTRFSDGSTHCINLSNLAYADEPEEKKEPYVPRVGDRVRFNAILEVVRPLDHMSLASYRLKSIKETGASIDFHILKDEVDNVLSFISRDHRILTKSEAEKLLKEKLGEDVTIEL